MNLFKKFFLLIFCFLFVSTGWADSPKFVYKLSTTSPDRIFQSGFNTGASVENFIQHMQGVLCERHIDGFVSTTTHGDLLNLRAFSYLRGRAEHHISNIPVYIYTIRATNDFYNSEITVNHLEHLSPPAFSSNENVTMARSLARMEEEYVTPNNIPASLIASVLTYTLNADGTITTQGQSNPNYQPDSTTANAGPYTGDDGLAPQHMNASMVSGIPPLSPCLSPEIEEDQHLAPFSLYTLSGNSNNNALDQ